METQCTYFTRRALQERTKAADASTPEARHVHLELALRLVRLATDGTTWSVPEPASPRIVLDFDSAAAYLKGVGNALNRAFPVQPSGIFQHLLAAIDAAERRRAQTSARG